MGQIVITLRGSFGEPRTATFSAMDGGHAAAVAEAITYLASDEMPKAVQNDHECHRDGIQPREGYGKRGLMPVLFAGEDQGAAS